MTLFFLPPDVKMSNILVIFCGEIKLCDLSGQLYFNVACKSELEFTERQPREIPFPLTS